MEKQPQIPLHFQRIHHSKPHQRPLLLSRPFEVLQIHVPVASLLESDVSLHAHRYQPGHRPRLRAGEGVCHFLGLCECLHSQLVFRRASHRPKRESHSPNCHQNLHSCLQETLVAGYARPKGRNEGADFQLGARAAVHRAKSHGHEQRASAGLPRNLFGLEPDAVVLWASVRAEPGRGCRLLCALFDPQCTRKKNLFLAAQ